MDPSDIFSAWYGKNGPQNYGSWVNEPFHDLARGRSDSAPDVEDGAGRTAVQRRDHRPDRVTHVEEVARLPGKRRQLAPRQHRFQLRHREAGGRERGADDVEDAEDGGRKAGAAHRLLLVGAGVERGVVARRERLVLRRVAPRLGRRAVERRVGEVHEVRDRRLARRLHECPDAPGRDRKERRVHDHVGARLGEERRGERTVCQVPARDARPGMASQPRGPLLLHRAPVAGVVEDVRDQHVLSFGQERLGERGSEESGASRDED